MQDNSHEKYCLVIIRFYERYCKFMILLVLLVNIYIFMYMCMLLILLLLSDEILAIILINFLT